MICFGLSSLVWSSSIWTLPSLAICSMRPERDIRRCCGERPDFIVPTFLEVERRDDLELAGSKN